jgi:hypothetical protein
MIADERGIQGITIEFVTKLIPKGTRLKANRKDKGLKPLV